MSDNEQAIESDTAALTRADLEKTIEFLKVNEWTQGCDIYFDEAPGTPAKFCLNGAIRAAIGGLTWNVEEKSYDNVDVYGSPLSHRALRVRYAIRDDLSPRYGGNIISFNDSEGRTKQEVIAQVTRTLVRLNREATDA